MNNISKYFHNIVNNTVVFMFMGSFYILMGIFAAIGMTLLFSPAIFLLYYFGWM